MRILQINNFEDIRGGSDRVYQLTTQMLIGKGHEVATITCGEKSFDERKISILLEQNGYLSANPITTINNIRNFIYRPEVVDNFKLLAEKFQPEIAHLHIFYGQISSSILDVLNELKIPCVMTVHEYRMLCPISTMYTKNLGICEKCATGHKMHAVINSCNKNSMLASTLSALEAWVRDKNYSYTSLIDHFLMVSEFCLKKHIEYLPELAAKSSVLYNFINEKDIAPTPKTIEFNAPFLYAGRISHEKGVYLMCKAFSLRSNINLRIAGSGPLLAELQKQFKNYPNIKFLGKLGSTELKEELANAKFSIVPSEWYENNPMSILESFGVGTPVLGSAIGGIPELVKHGETGIQFQPSNLDSLLEALDIATKTTVSSREKMGRNAIALIRERHTEVKYYEKLINEYQKAIKWQISH